jgi:diguanylate cyclase (GGDEF)-like protein
VTTLLQNKSLRFWVALGMVVAIAPLAASAGVGYFLLDRGVIAPIHDVSFRQREEIIPTQKLQLLIWDTLVPIDEHVAKGSRSDEESFRSLRTQIESGFAQLSTAFASEPPIQALVQRAREKWTAADDLATELLSAVPTTSSDPMAIEKMHRFHAEIFVASDRLEAIYEQLSGDIWRDHDKAVLFYERSLWLAGIAGAICLLTLSGAVLLIGRIIGGSVDRLVDGAARFAEGDRDHRIEIRVPPELHRVAEEFNNMIGRIRRSEEALSELAHIDSLTGLSNRRALDKALDEVRSRLQRYGEQCFLLAIDIDHFKRVNDAHGHAAGDQVLRSMANAIVQNLRAVDRAFRIGGEEFVVILPRTTVDEAREVAERLRQAAASTRIRLNDKEVGLTVSIGVSQASDGAGQGIVEADAALYQAKTLGRNRVVVSGGTGNSLRPYETAMKSWPGDLEASGAA